MAHIWHKGLKWILAGCGVVTALTIGSIHGFAEESSILFPIEITEDGSRIITDTAAELPVTQAGWYAADNGNLYYYFEDGTYAQSQLTLEDGTQYLFAPDGTLKTGWQTLDGSRYFYDTKTGQQQNGWISYRNNLYYVDQENGKYVGEWNIDGITYAFDDYGVLETGLLTLSDGTIHRFADDGTPFLGWCTMDGTTYYFDKAQSGAAVTGVQTIDQTLYCFDENGALRTDTWTTLPDGGRCYSDVNGELLTGFQTIGNHRYAFDASGMLCTGWVTDNGKLCYFQENGTAVTGWQTIAGKVY